MSDDITRESLRIGAGNLFACFKCGIPKAAEEFEGASIECRSCAHQTVSNRHAEVTPELLRKTKFELAREKLQESQDPAIPGGVRRAHEILSGKTSSELFAEALVEIRTGKKSDGTATFLPQDGKLYMRGLESLQRAEIKHDEFLQSQPPAENLSYEEAQSLTIDTFISEITRDKKTRIQILRILYERCPNLIDEIMEVSKVELLEHVLPSATITDLESEGVI